MAGGIFLMSDKPPKFYSEYMQHPSPRFSLDEAIERAMREVPGAKTVIQKRVGPSESREANLIHYLIDCWHRAIESATEAELRRPLFASVKLPGGTNARTTGPQSESDDPPTEGE